MKRHNNMLANLDKLPVALQDRKSGRSKKCSAVLQHCSSRFYSSHIYM